MAHEPPPDASRNQLISFADAIARFKGVARATVDRDTADRPIIRVELDTGVGSEPPPTRSIGTAIASIIDADLAAMLIFDAETLQIVTANDAARTLLNLEAGHEPSLADLYAPEELDRLGAALVGAPSGWADFGVWAMKASTEREIRSVRTWFGPAERSQHRLLIAAI